MSTSRAVTGSPRADLRSLVSNKPPTPLTWSAPQLQPPCRWPLVLPSPTSPPVHRQRALRLLWPPLQTLVPSRITSPHRLGLKVSQLHRPRINGPSPGKLVASVLAHLPSLRPGVTGRSSGFGGPRHLALPVRHTKGSLSLRWQVRSPASFRSLIGSRPAAALPTSSSLRGRGSFFGHPCLRLPVPFSQGPGLDLHQLAD